MSNNPKNFKSNSIRRTYNDEGTSTTRQLNLLSCINAASVTETLYTCVFTSIALYAWFCMTRSFDISFDPLVIFILSTVCLGFVVVWIMATYYNFEKYARNKQTRMVSTEHYNSIWIHMCFGAISSATLLVLSCMYNWRFNNNSNLTENKSGTLIETLLFCACIFLWPVDIVLYFNNYFIHKNPIPWVSHTILTPSS